MKFRECIAVRSQKGQIKSDLPLPLGNSYSGKTDRLMLEFDLFLLNFPGTQLEAGFLFLQPELHIYIKKIPKSEICVKRISDYHHLVLIVSV